MTCLFYGAMLAFALEIAAIMAAFWFRL